MAKNGKQSEVGICVCMYHVEMIFMDANTVDLNRVSVCVTVQLRAVFAHYV